MRFKALRHQPSDAARKSGYDNEGQLPDTLPDSRSRPRADLRCCGTADRFTAGDRLLAVPAHAMLCAQSAEFFPNSDAVPRKNDSMLADLGLTVARQIPIETLTGLVSGMYTVHGGVIRDAGGRIVSHLVTSGGSAAMSSLVPGLGVLGQALQGAQLWKIGKDVAAVQQTVNTVLNVAMTGTVLSGLGLVTSVAGFTYLRHRLNQLERNLADMAKDVKKIKLSQEGLHKSELQTAVDGARHAEHATDESVRRGLLIDSKREFNKLMHHYKQEWARSETVPEIQTVNELYTLAILGYAMVSSELGLQDAAALDLRNNCQDWTTLARGHAKSIVLGAHPERFIGGDYVEQLPAKVLVDLLDFAHDEHRGIEWFDELRLQASKHSTLFGSLASSAPDSLRKRLIKGEPEGSIELAKGLYARASVLDANVAHFEFLQDKQISASAFQQQLEDARKDSGGEAICVYPVEMAQAYPVEMLQT